MSTRFSTDAGVVTFGSIDPTDWQAVSGDLSGDWSDAAHWSTGVVPGIDDDVVISDDGSATSAWTVTETNESAAALTLTMHLGTLKATGGLSVEDLLTQTSGTLFAEALAGINVGGSLDQTGGVIVLDDDGSSFTPFSSSGTDTVDGDVTLVNGANWTDLGLNIGIGLASGGPVSASFTLQGGKAPGQLVVALGPMQIGGDPGSDTTGGTGTLVADNASGVTADSLSLLNHSVVSVDAESFVVIGPAFSADPGAVAIEGGAGVVADIATFDAAVVNDGTLSVVAWQGDDTTAPGDVVITGTLFSTDVVAVAAQATLNVAGGIEITGGSLSVGSGGTLLADSGAADSFGVYIAGGAMTLDGGTLNSSGTADFANANATLLDGALWTTRTLEIGPGFNDATLADATLALSGGSTLLDGSELFVGNDPTPGTDEVGGVGSVLLSGTSTLQATGIELFNGSTLSLDPTSTVMIGSASAEAGAVAVAAGQLLGADIATIDADIADIGTFDVAGFKGVAGGGPGDVRVSGNLTGTGKVFVTGTLEVGDASSFTGTIAIASGGELILDTGELADGLVAANSGTFSVDVVGQSFDASGFSPTYDQVTGLLVFGGAATQSTLDVGPGRALGDFSLAADGSGTLVTEEVPCFAAGTCLRAAHGEVPVEALRVGDRVATEGGGLRPVVWIGHRRVDCRRHPRPHEVQPVRVSAHAFGPDAPRRDLLLSPDHAVFAAGALIPVRYLLNGATVRQQDVASVSYWHVELDRHEVVLAEGLPCESYLDTGNRGAFANGGAVAQMHADFAREIWRTKSCAPLVLGGPRLTLAKRRLLVRAGELGHAMTDDPGLRVLADGCEAAAATVERRWRIRLPAAASNVRLMSRVWIPAHARPAEDDTRSLGIAISRLWFDRCEVGLDDRCFGSGWHAPEPLWRWTAGDAGLAVTGVRELAFEVALTGNYWQHQQRAEERAVQAAG